MKLLYAIILQSSSRPNATLLTTTYHLLRTPALKFAYSLRYPEAPDSPYLDLSLSNVLGLVQSGSPAQATNPRDCIYGLLGMAKNWEPGQTKIEIDYALNYVSIYVQATWSLLEIGRGQTLRLSTGRKQLANLPS